MCSLNGHSPDAVRQLCLGHVITGVRGTYDRHAYAAEKREAFEKLAKQVRAGSSASARRAASKRIKSPGNAGASEDCKMTPL